MKVPDILSAYAWSDRTTALAISAFLIATIALGELVFQLPVSLGFLYLIPILVAALFVSRKELAVLALVCTLLRLLVGPFTKTSESFIFQGALGFVAFFGCGLFLEELARRRRRTLEYLRNLEHQIKLRQEAEGQLRALIETSPAAILTVDEKGKIRLANQAAHQLLATDEPLTGQLVRDYLPFLANIPHSEAPGLLLRTAAECKGRRYNGEVFQAHVWFSTYTTVAGPTLAAIVLDTSEDLRDREELGLDRLMASSRVLVRAVSHEIRNLCAAIEVVHSNLQRIPGITENEDFRALGNLTEGLKQLVSSGLRPPADGRAPVADLHEVFEQLRIIIEPPLRDEQTEVRWDIPDFLPPVYADGHGLLQVFMNLVNNSRRALQKVQHRRLTISVVAGDGRLTVRFIDTGPGITAPELLFQPFQQVAEGSGLGLYLSRALMRSYTGDLRFEPATSGCCFAVELTCAPQTERLASV